MTVADAQPRGHQDALRLQLTAFMGYAFTFSRSAFPVREGDELPPVLERVALATERAGRTWLAWRDQHRTWFVAGEFAHESLRTFFYDEHGRLAACASWRLKPDGHWQLWER